MRTERDLMLLAGWLHLAEGLTQQAVAERLGMTRAKVNRLIATCREEGLVQVSINAAARLEFEAEQALVARYGLTDAFLVPTPEDPATTSMAIGIAAGSYVSQRLAPGQTLALGWGRTLDASVRSVAPRQPSGNIVVTLFGGLARAGTINPYDIAARYARSLAAECHYLTVPILVDTPLTVAALNRIPQIAETLRRAAGAHIALAGANGLSADAIEITSGLLTEEDWQRLRRAGAVGNVYGCYIDMNGRAVDDPVNRRRIALDLESVCRIPERVIAAGGPGKIAILRAALAAGLCTTLVSDLQTAQVLLRND